LAASSTYPLLVRGYQLAVEKMVEFDKDLIEALIARGFKFDLGEDKTGHQMKYRRRGGGYYLDCGCSGLIIDGEIGLLQFDTIERFSADGAVLQDGTTVPADLLVLATGYYTQQELVRRLLGDAVADNVGEIWGIGEDGEMGNLYKRTAQEGLWFIAGSLAQCRIYSKYLALQIKATEEGLIGPR
jgi:putative flavoprotein involved in K+ transport